MLNDNKGGDRKEEERTDTAKYKQKECIMNKEELRKQISDREKVLTAEKNKREMKVWIAFVVVYFLIFYIFGGKPEDIGEFVSMAISSVIMATLHFGINQAVFEHLFKEEEADRLELEFLKQKLFDIERKELDERIENYKRR